MGAAALPAVPSADRTSHPYHTYDMIREIPATFRETFRRLTAPAAETGAFLRDRPFLVFTGCGTASYAARLAGHFASSPSDRVRSAEVDAFELSNYGPRLDRSSAVIGISHSGITKTTVDALRDARARGARTVGITHFPGRPIAEASDTVLVAGNGPDLSRCHTKCYVAGALASALVALEWRVAAGGEPRATVDMLREKLAAVPALMDRVLRTAEGPCEDLASDLLARRSVGILGAGPNLPTALEAALKLRESSFLPVQGMELEDFLHGSWQPLDGESLVFVIATKGRAHARALDLMRAARVVGARVVAVAEEGDREVADRVDTVLEVPAVDELLSPFLNIIPLYLFAYYSSVERGHNPDCLRYLDPTYWEARRFIFPPGTH
ncbi:MAG TPA: SIS domain-containing protein [Thermoplasmata archaeon]|nr:SIS domain-containing protein [Thermoplasmata archaeon]